MNEERTAPAAAYCGRGVIVREVGAISGDLECTIERAGPDLARVLITYRGAAEYYEAEGSPVHTRLPLSEVQDKVLTLLRSTAPQETPGNPSRLTLAEISWKDE